MLFLSVSEMYKSNSINKEMQRGLVVDSIVYMFEIHIQVLDTFSIYSFKYKRQLCFSFPFFLELHRQMLNQNNLQISSSPWTT